MAGREGDPVLSGAILVQHVEPERDIVIYTHECLQHPEGYRTAYVLLTDRGEITDQYGRRLSA